MNTETVLDGQMRAGRKLLEHMRVTWGYPYWVTRLLLECCIAEAREAAERLRAAGVPESDLAPMMLWTMTETSRTEGEPNDVA